MRNLFLLFGLLAALAPSSLSASTRVAVFVDANARPSLQPHVEALEQVLVADLTSAGFEVIDRAILTDMVGYHGNGHINNESEGLGSGANLDAALQQNTTAQRLAQTLGAGYIVHAALIGLDSRQSDVRAYGYDTTITVDTLRMSLKIVNGSTGASVAAANVEVSEKEQVNADAGIRDNALSARLLAKASAEATSRLAKAVAAKPLASVEAVAENCVLTLIPEVQDLFLPLVATDSNGGYVVTNQKLAVVPTGVTVQIDGFVVGSAPGEFNLTPGLHTLTVMRDDLKPWIRTIKIGPNGMTLRPSLEMSDEALARWRSNSEFLTQLKSNEKLADAEVEMLKGLAQTYRQSGFKVDLRRGEGETSDINLDLGQDTMIVPSGMSALQQFGFDQQIEIKSAE